MPLKNLRLLFVEDDLNTQEQIKMILEDDVKELIQAYNGDEGYETFLATRPDIILTDINMPFSGLELTKKIKKIDKKIPIIIISAFADTENLLASINLGTNGFITKPIDIDLLYKQLNKVATFLHEQKALNLQKRDEIKNLYRLAHYDTLTNTANRLLFNIELDKSIESAKRNSSDFALYFIDLDHFKNINDNYGHEVGDLALRSVVHAISKVISSDDLLARRSGDEFLLIVRDPKTKKSFQEIAEQILDELEKVFFYKNINIQLSASIGISRYPQDTEDKAELLKLADSAMYHAKDSGKARFSFAKELLDLRVQDSNYSRFLLE